MAEEEPQVATSGEADIWNGTQFTPSFLKALRNFLLTYARGQKSATGTVYVGAGTVTSQAIPHGLGGVPKQQYLTFYPGGADPQHMTHYAYISTVTPANATNIYIDSYGTVAGYVTWYASL